jgi:hypothetical protein
VKEGSHMDEIAILKVQLAEANKLASERKDALDAAVARATTAEESAAALKAERDAGLPTLELVKLHETRADAAEKKLADLESHREEDIRAAAETRIKAQSVMGAGFRVDGMADADIHTVVIKKLAPKEDLTNATPVYKRARFDGLVDMYQANRDSLAPRETRIDHREASIDSKETRAKAWREQALTGGYKAGQKDA